MLLKRISILTGKTHEMEIKVSKTQIRNWQLGGGLIQNVMPELTPEEREFVRSGITPDEWNLVGSSKKSSKAKAKNRNLTVTQFIAKFGDLTDVCEAEYFDDASGIELEYAC